MDLDVPLPHDLAVESAALAAIFVQPERFNDVAAILTPGVMFRDAHRLILECAHAVHAKGGTPDLLALKAELERRGLVERVGGLGYISSLIDNIPRGTNVPQLARRLKELSESRDVVRALNYTAREVAASGATPDILGPLADALRRVERPSHAPRLRFETAREVMAAAPPREVVQGVAWAGCVTMFAAQSGVGKTFIHLSIASALSDGRPWFGRRTEQGSTALMAFEGDALGLRCRALARQGHGVDHVRILRASSPLSPRAGRDGIEEVSLGEREAAEALEALQADLLDGGHPPLRLLVVDTVRASLVGSEDQSECAAAWLRALRRLLARCPDAAAIAVHHAGWQDGDQQRRRERGSSAWRGNVDATIYAEAGDADEIRRETPIVLQTLKARDAERLAPMHLVRRAVDLGTYDVFGRPETSCVIDADRRTTRDRQAEKAAALEAEYRALDLRVLRGIFSRPDMAANLDGLRALVGGRKAAVSDSVTRLLQRGWVGKAGRGQPYGLTEHGREALKGLGE